MHRKSSSFIHPREGEQEKVMNTMAKTLTITVLSIFVACTVASHADASLIDYGVYKVEARINGDDLHPGLTKIDSKAPGLGSTSASAHVDDSYGPVNSSWSITPLTANEAQVNIDMSYQVSGSSYANSSAGQAGEVHFNYHSDTPFTVNYYWDLTWDIDHPSEQYNLNFFTQSVRLRIYDSMDNWWDPQWLPPPPQPKYYPPHGNYAGSTAIDVGAGDWLFIVFTGGSKSRWGGEWESLSGNVYLDFDGGERSAIPEPASAWLLVSGLVGLIAIRRRMKKHVH